MTRIYTRSGDDGTTGLPGGRRVDKNDPRVQLVGELDELSCHLGLAAAMLLTHWPLDRAQRFVDRLYQIQSDLLCAGSHLAGAGHEARSLPAWDARRVTELEREIDEMDETLPPLSNFILPGGHLAASSLHLARAVCRRAERVLADFAHSPLQDASPDRAWLSIYLNRLGDWLFVAARWTNLESGIAETIWRGGQAGEKIPD